MQTLAPRHGNLWRYAGFIGVASAMLIMSFYAVVAGWTMEYLFQSMSGGIVVGEILSTDSQSKKSAVLAPEIEQTFEMYAPGGRQPGAR